MREAKERGVFSRTLYRCAITLGSAAVTFGLLSVGNDTIDRDRMEEAVANHLRDPSSAQFRNIRGTGESYCGEVNGKNGFGAYAGFRRFIYSTGTVTLEPSEPGSSSPAGISRYELELARFNRLSKKCDN